MKIIINKINRIYILSLSAIVLAFFVFTSSVLASKGIDDAMTGLNTTAKQGFTGESTGELRGSGAILNLPEGIGQIIGAILAFVGVIFFGLMIYGGFTWMTARGNDQAVTKAKDLITAAIIGLVIVLAAYAITSYIGQIVTTVNPAG